MELTLQREPSNDVCTPGELYEGDQIICFTLEDIVREVEGQSVEDWKIYAQTAIPQGRYPIEITKSRRFNTFLPEILNVDGFEGIRIHAGNTAANTAGCILVGATRPNDKRIIRNSVVALHPLCARIQDALDKGEEVYITIKNGEKNV